MKQTKNSFKLLLTNANGLSNKLGEFQTILATLDVDIAIVTETKFSDETVASEITFAGYCAPLRRDRNPFGGGVAVWVKEGMPSIHLQDMHSADHETLWLTISPKHGKKIVVGAVYRPGSCSGYDISIIDHLDSMLDTARTHAPHILLVGDFNVHNASWLRSNKTTPAGEALEELSAFHHLEQHVHEPTRGENTLDLVLSDLPPRS